MFITSTASCLPLLISPWRELASGPAGWRTWTGAVGLLSCICGGQQARLLCVHRLALLCPEPWPRSPIPCWAQGLTGVTVLGRGCWQQLLETGGCSSSQFIPLLLAANAGAPLAVHEGPAAQGPDGVEHRVCHGFTGCGEGEDGQVRTGTLGWLRAGWEHPSPSPALSSMGVCNWKRGLLSFLSGNCTL